MKMNSVTDMDFIRKVQEASAAGVKVDLIVRGICCILPGVKENTEKSAGYEHCRKVSGTSESVCVRNRRNGESLYRIGRYDDEKYRETCGGCMSDL